ncbi:Stk1 family PASTA domain-containing Ser/Thr kinase [Psychromicrobium lacuslunae]|uniref:Stk1 family PASTA domain-containing Ser/Thr kinase n=1 Tax=Psychromicrobium lacuslunae TaxID=1618207 RepID=UPI0005D3D6B9|nr:Stk1 family PASTA domain-containing Ser/Thr kinase [Psychromicrobium lacuslunae]
MTEPRVLNGRYELDKLLGRGGMADVYLGKDIRLGRTIAVKLLRADLARDPQFQARFRREAQAVAGLNHPSIVAVYDTGDASTDLTGHQSEQTRVPYIVMEYVEGRTLRELIRQGDLSIDHAIDYALGVLSALEYSHRAGIVHRDIKPANVMVTQDGSAVKVMDFGIARAIADSSATMTQTQAVIGTAQYLSPEQARGETVDARSDLYSAACLFYEMLTGRPPFIGDSPVSVAYQHVRETAEAPSHFNSEVSAALDSVLARALQKDRQDRFQDAASFRRALRAAKAGVELSPVKPLITDQLAAEVPTKLPASPPPVVSTPISEEGPATRAMAKVLSGGSLTTESTEEEPEQLPLSLLESKEIDKATKRRRRAWIVTLFVVLALVLGGGGFYLFNQMTAKPAAEPTVPVPTVAGKLETDAVITLSNVPLRPRVIQVNSDTVESGKAISTDPAEGTEVPPNSEVTVKISKGPANIVIPTSLAKTTESAARDQLRQIGLTPGTTTVVNDPSIPQGQLVSTSPALGKMVEAGAIVNLNISSGKVTMPSVIGKTKDEAAKALKEASPTLVVSFVEEENSQVKAGKVTGQDPAANKDVDQGSPVTITLAKEPEKPSPTPTSSSSCTASPGASSPPTDCSTDSPSQKP